MRRKPALLLALQQLKAEADAQHGLNDSAFDDCRSAPADLRYAHALYREIGDIAIRYHLWDTAEEFAMKTLMKMPSSGAALKILGKSLQGRNRLDEAALCHRYRLPPSIRTQYFNDRGLSIISSAQSDKVETLSAYAKESRPVKPPLTLTHTDIPELSQSHLESSAALTFHLNNARLWFDGFNTTVWDSDGHLIDDASRGLAEVVNAALGNRPARKLSGKTCVLGNRNSGNYYHWMNDILPRVHVLIKSGIALDSIRNFVVNPLQQAFQFESLHRLGISQDRLVFSDSDTYFDCEELYLPVFGSNSLGKGQAPWTPAFLKETFHSGNLGKPRERLYISRKNAVGRSILNEHALILYLQKLGFRCVHLEGLTIVEQAELFSTASVILGAHGAGFSNTVFCEAGTTIIELYKDHIAPCYWLTSELTSLRHAVQYCGTDPDQSASSGVDTERYHESADKRRLSDFNVDLDKLSALLDSLDIS